MMESDFKFGSSSVAVVPSATNGLQEDLAKALKLKDKKPVQPLEDKKDNKWDKLSKINPEDSKVDISNKLLTFKHQMFSEVNQLQRLAVDLKASKKTKELARCAKAADDMERLIAEFNTCIKQGNPKREIQKKLLMDGYGALMHAKTVKADSRKVLPKEPKRKDPSQQEVEDEADGDEEPGDVD